MRDYVIAINRMNIVVKFILGLFFGPIIFGIYRIAKGRVILGIIWIFTLGLFYFGNIIDLITILLKNKMLVD